MWVVYEIVEGIEDLKIRECATEEEAEAVIDSFDLSRAMYYRFES